jgi:cysteinyl-tRNA synthetase
MNDDFNSPVLISVLFESAKLINNIKDGRVSINETSLTKLKELMHHFIIDVLGLKDEQAASDDLPKVVDFIVKLRNEAKTNRDYATSDKIRDGLQKIGIQLKDGKEGTNWSKA